MWQVDDQKDATHNNSQNTPTPLSALLRASTQMKVRSSCTVHNSRLTWSSPHLVFSQDLSRFNAQDAKYYICFHLLCPPATKKSWEYPFQGNTARGLWEHIKTHYNPLDYRVYAHCAAIVPSSGMGKSRTVDELAMDHFIVPLNLWEATSTGACGLCSGYLNMC